MNNSIPGRTATHRGGRIVALLIVIAAALCLLLSASAASDAALPAWAEPYLLMDTVITTEGSYVHSSAALDDRLLFFTSGELWVTDGAAAGTQRLARRIEWNPSAPVSLGTSAVFVAEAPDTGRELWVSGGHIGDPRVLLDIAPGADSSNPDLLTRMGDYVYFRTDDITLGDALWRTDGTAAGTVKIRSFSDPNMSDGAPLIREMAGADDRLYLWVMKESGAATFWSSDGTAAGTIPLHAFDSNAGTPLPPLLMTVGNLGFARNNQELWRSDGTPTGTFRITNAPLHTFDFYWAGGESVLYMIAHDLWKNKGEVWTSDGTVTGTRKVTDIGGGRLEKEMVTVGDMLFFSFTTDSYGDPYGMELWVSDGTPGGTKIVRDIVPGPDGSHPYSLVVVDDEVYFSVRGETELWRSDGTTAGTQRVVLNNGNPPRPFIWPRNAFQGRLFVMVADDLHGNEPWFSDGTTAGSSLLKDINTFNGDGSGASSFTFYRNRIYFVARGGLWVSDGGMNNAMELVPARSDWYVPLLSAGLISSNGYIYFTAENSGAEQMELWRSDGTTAGTVGLKQVGSTSYGNTVKEMVDLNGALYFLRSEGSANNELWRSNGTPAGTFPLDIFPAGGRPADVRELTASEPFLYFAGSSTLGSELWRTNGTRPGTGIPSDINPGPNGSNPTHLIDMGGILYFAAGDGRRGRELWRSNGTPSGTYLVKDINPAAGAGSSPSDLVVMHDTLYFLADDGVHGVELWRSDGTATGTRLVKDTIPGSAHPPALELVAGRDRVFFYATADPHTTQLWVSDGTAAGTLPIQMPANNTGYGPPSELTAVDNTLFFVIYPENNTIYRSDGITTATVALDDAFPFFSHYAPSFLTAAPGRLIFSANSNYGDEPFVALTSLVTLSPDRLELPEGGSAKEVTVALNRPPSVPVTIILSGSEPLVITPNTLTFTSTDWNIPHNVSISAPKDEIDQGTRPVAVRLNITSADATFIDDTHSLPALIRQWRHAYAPMVTR